MLCAVAECVAKPDEHICRLSMPFDLPWLTRRRIAEPSDARSFRQQRPRRGRKRELRYLKLLIEGTLVKREFRIDVAVWPDEESGFHGPIGRRLDEQEQAAGIVQANLCKSKIVNAES
jgi:hypothetical protein